MVKRTRIRQKRVCFFDENKIEPDYKNYRILQRFVTERGKILPRRTTSTCATHQRRVAVEVKRARHLGLLPFVAENVNR
jgi:small subunit ribosomal protein S18